MSGDINSQEFEPDLSYLSDVASGSVEFMIDMINIFLEQTPLYFEQLTEAVSNKDWTTTGDIAHKIKPTFAFIGIGYAKDAMSEIERKARKLDSVETIEPELNKIKTLCASLYFSLEEKKRELEAGL